VASWPGPAQPRPPNIKNAAASRLMRANVELRTRGVKRGHAMSRSDEVRFPLPVWPGEG
jgi:hypothetical protein